MRGVRAARRTLGAHEPGTGDGYHRALVHDLWGAAVERLQEQAATQEARLQQAAQRDQELARSRDDLLERMDAESRSGAMLPATARELFLPTRTNESPLALYGTVAQAFHAFSKQNTTFRDQVLQLRPYLLLNERIRLL